MGPLAYGENEDEVFLGRSVTQHKHISDETHRQLDQEVRHFIDDAYAEAKTILETNRDKLEVMADALMRYETIDTQQIDQIMLGQEPDPPKGWQDDSTPPPSAPSAGEPDAGPAGSDDDAPSGEPAPS
jgi:cell division protease FtsH